MRTANSPFAQLINAIDQQDLPKVKQFIKDHPRLDYNNIPPAGLSALWIAFFPPKGKKISSPLVAYLLRATRQDGSKLINPIQAYLGKRPSELQATLKLSLRNRWQLSNAENNFVDHQAPRVMAGLGAVAADQQNTHNPLVVKLCDENTARLYAQYGKPTNDDIRKIHAEISKYIKKEETKDNFNSHQLRLIRSSLERCLLIKVTRNYSSKESSAFTLSISELLTLALHAVNETNPELLPMLMMPDTASTMREKRITALLQAFLNAQTAYGDNNPACEMGTRNQLALALAGMHKCVQAGLGKEVKLTGTLAIYFMSATLGNKLIDLSKKDLATYWLILRNTSALDDSDASELAYQAFINKHKKRYRAIFKDQVASEDIDKFFASLSDAFPLFGHGLSQQLVNLVILLHKRQQPIDSYQALRPEVAYKQALDAAAHLLIQEKGWNDVVNRYGITNPLTFAKRFIDIWQTVAPIHHLVTPPLSVLWANNLDLKQKDYFDRSLSLTLWDTQKKRMLQSHPEQEAWIKQLSTSDIDILLTALIAKHGEQVASKLNENFTKLISLAMELKFTRNMSLKNIKFHDLSLRGMDFRGANLRGAKFVNCDWRGAVYDEHTQFEGVTIKHCTIIDKVWRDTPYWILSLLANPKELHTAGEAVLPWAAKNGYANFVRALLHHKHCTREFFTEKSGGYNVLAWAVLKGHTDIVKDLLEHKYCSKKYFMQKFTGDSVGVHAPLYGYEAVHFKFNLLQLACLRGQTKIAQLLVTHKYCSAEFFEQTPTALFFAIRVNNTALVKLLLGHKYCNKDYFAKKRRGMNVLHQAYYSGNTAIMKALLASPYCTNELFNYQDILNEYRVSCLAAQNKNIPMLRELITHRDAFTALSQRTAGSTCYDELKRSEFISVKEFLILHPEVEIMSRLSDYASTTYRLFSGKWNHHHVTFVKKLLKTPELTLDIIHAEIDAYNATLPAGEKIKPNGTLGKIYQLLPSVQMMNPPQVVAPALDRISPR